MLTSHNINRRFSGFPLLSTSSIAGSRWKRTSSNKVECGDRLSLEVLRTTVEFYEHSGFLRCSVYAYSNVCRESQEIAGTHTKFRIVANPPI